MLRPGVSNRLETRVAVRIIPFFIVAAFGFATYDVVAHLGVNYLCQTKKQTGPAIALIVLYLAFLLLTLATYLRTLIAVQFNTGFVPLDAGSEATEKGGRTKATQRTRGRDVESQPWVPPDESPDSPGLEAFYSKEVFVCEYDGRPRWCSDCRSWKPDRASHCSEMDRCVRKMDHLCPWVGGVISETSFNFFIQFTFYCAMCCAMCIATCAYSLKLQLADEMPLDGLVVAGLVLGAFFGFFTMGMALTSVRFAFLNITNIDMLKNSQFFRLAVHIPSDTPPTQAYRTITYPLETPNRPGTDAANNGSASHAARDQQAKRVFAILETDADENPWDLGYWRNWKSVMGNSVVAWLLPIWHSPCCNHDSMESDYQYGYIVDELKKRYAIIQGAGPAAGGVEMQSVGVSGQS